MEELGAEVDKITDGDASDTHLTEHDGEIAGIRLDLAEALPGGFVDFSSRLVGGTRESLSSWGDLLRGRTWVLLDLLADGLARRLRMGSLLRRAWWTLFGRVHWAAIGDWGTLPASRLGLGPRGSLLRGFGRHDDEGRDSDCTQEKKLQAKIRFDSGSWEAVRSSLWDVWWREEVGRSGHDEGNLDRGAAYCSYCPSFYNTMGEVSLDCLVKVKSAAVVNGGEW